jgi:hypothetical protein
MSGFEELSWTWKRQVLELKRQNPFVPFAIFCSKLPAHFDSNERHAYFGHMTLAATGFADQGEDV